jgi:hypothetical protein
VVGKGKIDERRWLFKAAVDVFYLMAVITI